METETEEPTLFTPQEADLLALKARLEAALDAGANTTAASILEDLDRREVSKVAVHKTGLGVYLNLKVSKMPVAKVSARALRICNK